MFPSVRNAFSQWGLATVLTILLLDSLTLQTSAPSWFLMNEKKKKNSDAHSETFGSHPASA